MANAVQSKLEAISGERTAKVNEIKNLQSQLRKAGLTDAQIKDINAKIKTATTERIKLESDYNKLAPLVKTAEEYTTLNKKLAELESSISKAEARGESTTSLKQQRNVATSRLKEISSDVETNFPELKTTTATKPTQPVFGPDAARAGKETVTAPAVTGPEKATVTKDANGNVITQPIVKTPVKPTPKPIVPGAPSTKPKTLDEIIALVTKEYGPIDSIFKTNDELGVLLRRAFDKKLTPSQFVNELENTTWFKSNAGEIQQRGFYKRQYDDLRKTTKDLESLDNTTQYGRGLKSTRQLIADEALREGVILDPAELDLMARDIYDNAYETTPAMIKSTIRAKIKYSPNSILSGKAGEDLTDLKKIAAANGLDLDKAFGNSIQGWLQKVAQGESIETYKGIIRQAAKVGLPEKVGSLLDQGVDLETIYNPYKNILASTLEINPETITLNDPVLRSAIGPDKELSLYDFQRQLRKDPRWQYTNNAREETSNAVMKVLQDFGFQG
jgi:myosin heavy subunit